VTGRGPALEVAGVAKRFGEVEALVNLSLVVEAGEVCVLLGPNGSGKTTLSNVIAGLVAPDHGTVRANGIDVVADRRAAQRTIGYAPQELGVYPSLTAREGLTFFGELSGLRGPVVRERIDLIAEALELVPLLDLRCDGLSGGQKRRVHTAMAMLHRPALLVLDEPTVGVDLHARQRLLENLLELVQGSGTALCYTTHHLEEAEALGATLAVIDGGVIRERGTIAEVVGRHARRSLTVTFDGAAPAPPAGYTVEAGPQTLRFLVDEPAAQLSTILQALDAGAGRIRGIDVDEGQLESAYLALVAPTGRAAGPEAP
jgi:ABC-2 type transport system ATP-binding protein